MQKGAPEIRCAMKCVEIADADLRQNDNRGDVRMTFQCQQLIIPRLRLSWH